MEKLVGLNVSDLDGLKRAGVDLKKLASNGLDILFTQIFRDEKITPKEGLEEEFIQIIDNILSDVNRTLNLVKLKTELRAKVAEEK